MREALKTFYDVSPIPFEGFHGFSLGVEGVLAHQDFNVEVFVFEEFQGDDVPKAAGGSDEEDVLGESHGAGGGGALWRS